MINEKRMDGFEVVYGELHDVLPQVIKQHRFKTEDSYSLPALASDYRLYCAALDSVVVELPSTEGFGYSEEVARVMRDGCADAIQEAGVDWVMP